MRIGRAPRAWVGIVLWGTWLLACGQPNPPSPSVGSNSNWLRACTTANECGDLPACRCGACTLDCSADAACGGLGSARCAFSDDPAVWASCASDDPGLSSGICLPRCEAGGCKEDQACVEGACVRAPSPSGAFCEPVAAASVEQRTREEQLLSLVEDRRTAGEFSCAGAAARPAQTALRFDTRLRCAARALALDHAQSGGVGLNDSQGRTTTDRLSLVGYAQRVWGEAFAVRASSPADALQLMLSDVDTCGRFADASFRDIGVGNSGSSYVVTIAAPQ